ncbi:putative Type I secretion membrane fusion protein, HlyD [Vibrio nigripulchritudo SOn1]|uniref:Membrane fusion protein (MFP) family protein n=1 Tax=Vibrio nigripulchritudo SOn1 TaxID=1238450 RepID=A0AAV2VPF6_9VIBR|nr:HlyD family type I secretion periplasmic adaptor subunit [Vibrio nigripulchritudo]CCO46605.1 putative Type I secretion membrane fusion protein, HlyD [Vibrio nigripulchritudo SOn1]
MKDSLSLMTDNNRLIRRALVFLVVSLGFFATWTWFAKLDSAAIASGIVIVESKRKSIEHLEGGIVADVYVREGQQVEKGAPLIKISDITFQSRLKQIQLTWISRQIEYQRLLAERGNLDRFVPNLDKDLFPHLVLEIETLIANQQSLFASRVDMRNKELDIVDSRLKQTKNRRAFSSQMLAQRKQALEFLNDEIEMHDQLLADGFTSRLKVLELKRSEVLLVSDIISVQAELDGQILSVSELEQQKSAIQQRNRSEVETKIAEVRNALISLEAELKLASDVQARTVVKSPVSGVVLGLQVNTSGEVVGAGESLMEIVPDNDSLIVEAIINPTDIDVVRIGQQALIRLSAFNFRTTPPVHGEVVYIDADRIESNGEEVSGFKVKVKLNQDEISKNPDLELYPGMPAEVYVLLEEKRPLDYLLEPLKVSLLRAFRES